MKILIVEDDDPIRRAYLRWFKNHEVVELRSVATAISFLAKSNFCPDAILCDNDTGLGPRGIDFAKELSVSGFSGRFVLCSGSPELPYTVSNLDYKLITKPASMKDVVAAIENL